MIKKIKEIKPGDSGVYIEALISNVIIGKTNGANRATYLSLSLQDDTGTIDAKLWQATDEQVENIKAGCVVQIQGDVIKYNEDRQMKIIKINVTSSSVEDQIRFLKKAPVDSQLMINTINAYIEKIDNLKLYQIVKTLFQRNIKDFEVYPAATKNHHEYTSGLAHHTYGMLRLADAIVGLYPGINKALLYSGIILHDLGKTIELSGPVVPEYTMAGKLLGHISIAQAMIKETADELNISGEEVTLLQHMILSHHGKYEFGSPVLPLVREAEILSFIDNLDARIAMIDKAYEQTEPGEFTKRVFSLENRSFYKPKI